jgi:HSP20 family molecular chaperone IbpA
MFWPVRHRGRSNFLDKFDEMDSIFGNLYDDIEAAFGYSNYKNDKGDYVIEIECPGFNKDNLKVEISEGIMTVQGERESSGGNVRRIFKRYTVGKYEDVDAKIEDGILTLTMKVPEEKKKTVEIK